MLLSPLHYKELSITRISMPCYFSKEAWNEVPRITYVSGKREGDTLDECSTENVWKKIVHDHHAFPSIVVSAH